MGIQQWNSIRKLCASRRRVGLAANKLRQTSELDFHRRAVRSKKNSVKFHLPNLQLDLIQENEHLREEREILKKATNQYGFLAHIQDQLVKRCLLSLDISTDLTFHVVSTRY
jgi:hypothetical protein